MFYFILICSSCSKSISTFDWQSETVVPGFTTTILLEDLQRSFDFFVREISLVQLSSLLLLENEKIFDSPECPDPFPGVQGLTVWNAQCSSSSNTYFDGRSQALYLEEQEWEGAYYHQMATFISAYSIQDEEEKLSVNGYGDIRITNEESKLEIVGTFDYQGTELDWPSTLQSISIIIERSVDFLSINGGISQANIFESSIVGMHFEELVVQQEGIQGELFVQLSNGASLVYSLHGLVADCSEGDEPLCWDLSVLEEMAW